VGSTIDLSKLSRTGALSADADEAPRAPTELSASKHSETTIILSI
jgi:hypothetical protein